MENTYNPNVGDIAVFELDGETFASRVARINGTVRQMVNTVNLTKGVLANLKGTKGSCSDPREITREESQRYHDILLGKQFPHYKGEDYMPAGTLIRLNDFLCLTSLDIIAVGKVENFQCHGVYDMVNKVFPHKINIEGDNQIEKATEEEAKEYWDAMFVESYEAA